MKRVSIYSLLIVLLASCNPLLMKANTPKSAMSILKSVMSDPNTLVLTGCTLSFGILGSYALKLYWHCSKKAAEHESTNTHNDPRKQGTLAARYAIDYRGLAESGKMRTIYCFSALCVSGFFVACDIRNKILH
jgi:hypothetical protein